MIGLVISEVPPVGQQNDLVLTDWQIHENEGGDRFLFGLMPNGRTIRMTSSIRIIDPAGRIIQTGSGRRYHLSGAPASDPDLLNMMAVSAVAHGLMYSVDATEFVWREILRATH